MISKEKLEELLSNFKPFELNEDSKRDEVYEELFKYFSKFKEKLLKSKKIKVTLEEVEEPFPTVTYEIDVNNGVVSFVDNMFLFGNLQQVDSSSHATDYCLTDQSENDQVQFVKNLFEWEEAEYVTFDEYFLDYDNNSISVSWIEDHQGYITIELIES